MKFLSRAVLLEHEAFTHRVGYWATQRMRADLLGADAPTPAWYWPRPEFGAMQVLGRGWHCDATILPVHRLRWLQNVRSSVVREDSDGTFTGIERCRESWLVWSSDGTFQTLSFRAQRTVRADVTGALHYDFAPVNTSQRNVSLADLALSVAGGEVIIDEVRRSTRITVAPAFQSGHRQPLCGAMTEFVQDVLDLPYGAHPMGCPCELDIFRPTCPWVEARLASP